MRGAHHGRRPLAAVLAVAACIAAAGRPATASGLDGPRLVPHGEALPQPADWIGGAGSRLVFGAADELCLANGAAPRAADVRCVRLPWRVVDGIAGGRTLVLSRGDGGLAVVDLDRPALAPVELSLDPPIVAPARVAFAGGLLAVAENRAGVRLLAPAGHAGLHGALVHWRQVGFLPLPEEFTALAASGTHAFVTTASGKWFELDVGDPPAPRVLRSQTHPTTVHALAADGDRLYRIDDRGLTVGAARVFAPGAGSHQGSSMRVAGRTLYVARGGAGLRGYRLAGGGPQTFTVNLGNNFFSPAALSIDPGDTVRWSNVTFVGHNVRSCVPAQSGCDGATAAESFTSGAPSGFWSYSYTFTGPGENPYVCVPHFSEMQGTVTVAAPSAAPPVVPDGAAGVPMTVEKLDPAGSTLRIAWDTTSCAPISAHHLLYGGGTQLPTTTGATYSLAGSRCDLGATSPFDWSGTPDPATDPSGLIWWVVLADDGASIEGSWGRDGADLERNGPGPGGVSAECGMTAKDVTNTCGE